MNYGPFPKVLPWIIRMLISLSFGRLVSIEVRTRKWNIHNGWSVDDLDGSIGRYSGVGGTISLDEQSEKIKAWANQDWVEFQQDLAEPVTERDSSADDRRKYRLSLVD